MKTTLSQDGVLEIEPENGLEAYALRIWCEESQKNIKSFNKLVIKIRLQEPKDEV